MHQLSKEHLTALLDNDKGPCISVYMPTHRTHPQRQRDPLILRNMIRQMERSLREKFPDVDHGKLLDKFRQLETDRGFWNRRTESVAVLGSAQQFHIFDLARPVKELLVVADSFHIKPLLRILQSADRYHVLYVSREHVRLFEGNRDLLEEIELRDVPTSISDALGEEMTEPSMRVAAFGPGGSGGHGTGSRKEELETDTIRFFRVVDKAITEHYSRPTGLPMLLAALHEHHAEFRSVSHNPSLMKEGLMMDISALSPDELRKRAWQHVEPQYQKRLNGLIERYQSAQADRQGSDSLRDVVPAALDGRVAALLIEADRQIPGRIDAEARKVRNSEMADADTDDILDDLAELVLRMDGEVVIVPPERMPRPSGLAAIYRY